MKNLLKSLFSNKIYTQKTSGTTYEVCYLKWKILLNKNKKSNFNCRYHFIKISLLSTKEEAIFVKKFHDKKSELDVLLVSKCLNKITNNETFLNRC